MRLIAESVETGLSSTPSRRLRLCVYLFCTRLRILEYYTILYL